MDELDVYRLPSGKSAKATYEMLKNGLREDLISEAERIAAITVPSAFPASEDTPADVLGGQNQSAGCRLVNDLASNIMYAGFPPGLPFVKYAVTDTAIDAAKNDPRIGDEKKAQEIASLVRTGLTKLANSHRVRMESTSLRDAYVRYIKQLLVGGNCAFDFTELDHPVVWKMPQYVCWRDHKGRQLGVIVEKTVHKSELSEDVQAELEAVGSTAKATAADGTKQDPEWHKDTIKVYRVCLRDKTTPEKFHLWEEVDIGGNSKVLEDSTDTWHKPWLGECAPIWAGWLQPETGYNWGRSYCSDYRGDFFSLENFGAAAQDAAAAEAFTLGLIRPGSTLKANDLKSSRSLDFHVGGEKDLTTVNFGKSGSLAAMTEAMEKVERRLGKAFMSGFSVQRDAERVTKAEWQYLMRELEKAMGGLYSALGPLNLLPIVRQFIYLHSEEEPKAFESFSKDSIKMGIVAGADTLGQDIEVEALRDVRAEMNELMTPEGAARRINDDEVARRLVVGRNIPTDNLLVDPEARAQQEQQAQQQATLHEAAPGMLQEGTKIVGNMLSQQQPTQGEQPNGG